MIILMPVMKFLAISIVSRNALALVHFMQRITAADELFVNLCDNKAVSKVARVTTDGESDPGETGGALLGLAPLLLNLEILSLYLSLYLSVKEKVILEKPSCSPITPQLWDSGSQISNCKTLRSQSGLIVNAACFCCNICQHTNSNHNVQYFVAQECYDLKIL